MFRKPVTLLACVRSGSLIDRGTEPSAAWCSTMSTDAHAFRHASGSVISASKSVHPLVYTIRRVQRLTAWPRRSGRYRCFCRNGDAHRSVNIPPHANGRRHTKRQQEGPVGAAICALEAKDRVARRADRARSNRLARMAYAVRSPRRWLRTARPVDRFSSYSWFP